MKFCGTLLIANVGLLIGWAAEDAKPTLATDVVITTAYIDRLVVETRTNDPSLKAADSRVRSPTLNVEAVRRWDDPMAVFGGSVYSSRALLPDHTDPDQKL